MTDSRSLLLQLAADCDAHGIRLVLAGDSGLTIDAPHSALTPDLLTRLKAHKAEILTLLRRAQGFDMDRAPDADTAPVVNQPPSAEPVCRCGSPLWRDVPIHGGQSVRRDCGRCGRLLGFPIWYGKEALQNDK